MLFESQQRSNQELTLAYDATIEGWSRALDLRDRETEGHTQRVTELTIKVARTLGFSEEELTHIRRGALLHDMGKMAIPDDILQKPGPLNEVEWERMRRHPMYAYDMLSPIAYLLPSLDIPFCHHERWDGSGYPRGLKGEEIPLVARLFSIVDVWDALSSDRPYRKKMPRWEVVSYLREKSGILFDPKLVDIFLSVIDT
jgi:HD-GYP domain-containing protein (c-di-GMP phosphodiesterase class II)